MTVKQKLMITFVRDVKEELLADELEKTKHVNRAVALAVARMTFSLRSQGVDFTDYDAHAFLRGLVAEKLYVRTLKVSEIPSTNSMILNAAQKTILPFFDDNDGAIIFKEMEKIMLHLKGQ